MRHNTNGNPQCEFCGDTISNHCEHDIDGSLACDVCHRKRNADNTKTKHTPGSVNRKVKRFVDAGSNGDGLKTICDCDPIDEMPRSEAEANAKLIAAAPELLEMCERFMAICKRGGDIQRGPKGKEFDLEAKLAAILAKAKGEV